MLHRGGLYAASLAIAAVIGGGGAGAPAQAAGDANEIKGVVAEHCVKCHAVPGYSTQSLPSVEAPSFQEIADNPKIYTQARLRAFLRRPHWPMGQFRFSPRDIDNTIAFLEALRTR